MATRTAGATVNPRATFTAVAEPARRPAVAAVKAVTGIADQTGVAAIARRAAGARSRGPGVAIAQQDAPVGVIGGAVTDKEPQDAARLPSTDRRGARRHRKGRHRARERIRRLAGARRRRRVRRPRSPIEFTPRRCQRRPCQWPRRRRVTVTAGAQPRQQTGTQTMNPTRRGHRARSHRHHWRHRRCGRSDHRGQGTR